MQVQRVRAVTLHQAMRAVPLREGEQPAGIHRRYQFALQAVGIQDATLTSRILGLEPDTAGAPVLLIDELDRTDEAFEAYLLEVLSDFQVTIPELGTIVAVAAPTVILTSNSERDLGDALKRRCLHLHIGFPEQRLEERIVESRVPDISQTLRKQMVSFIHEVRTLDLKKLPSVSEPIDWARVLVLLQAPELGHEVVKDTLNVLLKYEADIEATMPQVSTFIAKASRQNVFG
jgi:MoxR-like ATPase